MSVLHTIEELEQLREEARKALHDPELIDKKDDLNQSLEQIRKEKNSIEHKFYKQFLLCRALYPDREFKVNQSLIDFLTEDLVVQIDSKSNELYNTVLHVEQNLRSSINLYSKQIQNLKKQSKKEEKMELTSRKKEQKYRKDNRCHQSNSVHPLAHNPYFVLLS